MTINLPQVTINIHNFDPQFKTDVLKELGDLKNMINAAEQAIIDGFNTATTAVGDRIAGLIAQGTDNPEFLSALNEEVATLRGLGTTGVPVTPVLNPDPAQNPDTAGTV